MAATTSVRVRYPEVDAMGVAHHTHFLVWFEIGRTDLLRDVGYPYVEMESDGILMPVVEAACRYLHPARYDDLLTIETSLEQVTRVTVRFGYSVRRERDGLVLATGTTRHAAVGSDGAPRRLPRRLLEALPPSTAA